MEMTGYIRIWRWLFVLMLGVLYVAPTISQTATPQDVVVGFIAAQNRQDLAAMRTMVAADARFMVEAGQPSELNASFDEYFQEPLPSINVVSITETAPDTVQVSATASGGNIPALPTPYTFTATYTVQEGQITGFQATLTDETRAALAAAQQATPADPAVVPATPGLPTDTTAPTDSSAPVAQPGQAAPQMPVTGASPLLLPLSSLALMLILGGFVMRRSAITRSIQAS
jgi:hypothetical protein